VDGGIMKVQINIEQGKAGLYYATSPEIKGLLVAEVSILKILNELPNAYLELIYANEKLKN
jgi:hypothetical protein